MLGWFVGQFNLVPLYKSHVAFSTDAFGVFVETQIHYISFTFLPNTFIFFLHLRCTTKAAAIKTQAKIHIRLAVFCDLFFSA